MLGNSKKKEFEKSLPENVPIEMLWFVRDPSELEYNQLPLPDNESFPYKTRLLNWADHEPQREIRLYYISTGLTIQQVQKIYDLESIDKGGKTNIKIVDFNNTFKDKYDLGFLENKKIPFAWKIDVMRLIMLIENGPAIYLDFDILPAAEKIGEISMNDTGYKMAPYIPWNSDDLENSIICVNSKDNFILSAVYNTMKYLISNQKLLKKNTNNNHLVWKLHLAAVRHVYNQISTSQCLQQKELEQKLQEWLGGKEINSVDMDKRNEYFSCQGNFIIRRELSWEKSQYSLYKQEGNASLPLAAKDGKKEEVEALIAQGANINKSNECGTPLILAAENGHMDVVNSLITAGANVDKEDEYGKTPLSWAAKNGHMDVVNSLIKAGANVDKEDEYGKTPLSWAAKNGHMDVVNSLITAGANVDKEDEYGKTPLSWAAENGHMDVVNSLITAGANSLKKNKYSKTPRDLANNENVIQLLKEAETKHIISKAIKTGVTLGIITALIVGIQCGVITAQLPILAIVGIAVAAALVIGVIVGGITYLASKPSDKLDKPDLEVATQQVPEKAY